MCIGPYPFLADGAPVGVVSPHLDDAALSCGRLLCDRPGSHVVTVFAAGASHPGALAPWDELSGVFRPGDDVMTVRRAEDIEAVGLALAHAHHLGFLDFQYRCRSPRHLARLRPWAVRSAQKRAQDPALASEIADALRPLVAASGVAAWFGPLGLWHVDHKLVARACLQLATEMKGITWAVYEELPYADKLPAEAAQAREQLEATGFTLSELAIPHGSDPAAKRALVGCYRSQLKPLGDDVERALSAPETYFGLVRPA